VKKEAFIQCQLGPNPARGFSRSSSGAKAPKFLKSLSGNLADFRPPKRGPNLDAGHGRLLADAAASLKISVSDLVE
jgi:hypothetical protein